MCKSIIANAPQLRKDLLAPERQAQRQALIAMLAAGATVVRRVGAFHIVGTTDSPIVYCVFSQTLLDGGSRYESCNCAARFATAECATHNLGTQQVNHSGSLPCDHILVARFWALDGLDRGALLIADLELRAAFLAGQRGDHLPALAAPGSRPCTECGAPARLKVRATAHRCPACDTAHNAAVRARHTPRIARPAAARINAVNAEVAA